VVLRGGYNADDLRPLVQQMVAACPEAARIRDNSGMLPLLKVTRSETLIYLL
jgi:hypothetical protein